MMADEKTPGDARVALRPEHHHRGDSRLHQLVDEIDEQDAEARYREEAADNKAGNDDEQNAYPSSAGSDNEAIIVAWEENDPENPYNWSSGKKSYVLITCMLTVVNSTLGSSLPSNAIPYITRDWGVTSESQMVLPISIYLVGYVFGPLFWAPLSEQFGRRNITVATFIAFVVWTMACGLAPNWPAFLVFRLLTGAFASSPIAIVSGIFADIYGDPRTRGRGMAVFMATTVFGPLFAPIISGFCSPTIGWRWTFWIALMYAGVTLVFIALLPETYGPVLLKRRAQRLRRADPKANANVVAPHEMGRQDLVQLATVVLTRPLRMLAFELIVSSTCCYLALVYAIFYMTFQAYPLIFQGIYGLSPGVCGLVFLSIGVGALAAMPVFWAYDGVLRRAKERGDAWTRREEYRRVPLACLGGPLFVVSLFWLGWTARAGVPFVVPMLAGIPFGMGFMLIFMALLNYLTDAYEIFAASANAAASCCRSLLATVLPLASDPMFRRLGIAGGCSLLGGMSLLMCAIPFLFIATGERIRAGSRFCQALRERREEMEARVEAQRRRREGAGAGGREVRNCDNEKEKGSVQENERRAAGRTEAVLLVSNGTSGSDGDGDSDAREKAEEKEIGTDVV